jgi:hypothetical protein
MVERMTRLWLAVALGVVVAVPSAVHGQARSKGPTVLLTGGPVKNSAVAYDAKNDVYLVVSAYGNVRGRFVSGAGTPLGSEFSLRAPGNPSFGHTPRATYSPHANGGQGAFLVTWHEDDGPMPALNQVNARLVAYPLNFLTGEIVVSGNATWWEAGADVSYSSASQVFLVVWRSLNYQIIVRRLGLTGQPLGSDIGIAVNAMDPSVTYNPQTDEFLVAYVGWDQTSPLAAARRIRASDGALMNQSVLLHRAGGTWQASATYNQATREYLVAWQQGELMGRRLNAQGNPVASTQLLSMSTGGCNPHIAYPAALGMAYNPTSGTFLAVGHMPCGGQPGALELNAQAVPTGPVFAATTGPVKYFPQVAASTRIGDWMIGVMQDWSATTGQLVESTSSTGPTGPSLVSPANGSQLTSRNVTFSWTGVSGAASYHLEIGSTNGGSDLFSQNVGTNLSVLVPNLPVDGRQIHTRIWWLANGTWRATSAFTHTAVFPPARPTPTGQITTSRLPTLMWTPGARSTWYRIWLDGPGGSVAHSRWVRSSDVCGASSCRYTWPTALRNGPYYWWVRSWNDAGEGPWSSLMSFRLAVTPGVPTLVSPNGHLSVLRPTYVWNHVPSTMWYRVYIQGPSSVLHDTWYRATAVCGLTTCAVQPALNLPASGTYQWWVLGWDQLSGPWSAGMHFSR